MLVSMTLAVLTAMLALSMLVLLLFPKSQSALSLRQILVDPLSRWMTQQKPIRVIGMVILVLLCLAGPEMWLVLTAMGIDAAGIEVIMLVWLAATAGGMLNALRTVKRKTGALLRAGVLRLRRGSARSPRRPKSRQPGRKGDDKPEPAHGHDWAFA